jgi:hypothetical protein
MMVTKKLKLGHNPETWTFAIKHGCVGFIPLVSAFLSHIFGSFRAVLGHKMPNLHRPTLIF